MSTLQGSWLWYELMSTDPQGAKVFYEAVVGWQIAAGAEGSDEYGFLTAPDGEMVGGLLHLTPDMAEHGARPAWIGYVGVDDVDAAASAIEGQGGKVLMPAREVEMAGRIAMVADPGGAPFYIMKPSPPPGSEGGASMAFQADRNPGHCGWNELMAGDPKRETAFYTDQFGWSLPDGMDMGEHGTYQFVAHDGVTVGAIMGLMGTPQPMWNHYFWVPGITQAKARIEENGGQVINGPMEVPGGDWIVQGIDPQGAMFSLVGPLGE